MQIFKRRNFRLDVTNHHRNRSTLTENVHTETTHIAGANSKVTFLIRFKALLLVAVHDIIQEGIHHQSIYTNIEGALQGTVDTINRRNAHTQVHIGCTAIYHFAKQLFNAELRLLISH